MDALIAHQWSNLPQTANTPNHVTDNVSFSFSREATDYKDANNKAVSHSLRSNPLMKVKFTGKIFALAGLALVQVGAAVTDLPNFTDLATGVTLRGHDPDDGTLIMEDAEDTLPGGPEMIGTSWTVGHYPFME